MQVSVLGPVVVNSDSEEVAELTAMSWHAAHSRTVGTTNVLGTRAAIPGNRGRLKERAARSLMKLNKEK